MYKKLGFILVVILLGACSTQYRSANKTGVVGYEVALCTEEQMLVSAYEAIERKFPNTSITQLAGGKIGYSFYAQPLLDRTTFDFVIQKVQTSINGGLEEGYVYEIKTYGTQFFVEERYVTPLVAEFESTLSRNGIMLAKVPAIKYTE